MEKNYSELALESLEKDIAYITYKWHIPNYDKEDLEQELRLKIWWKIDKYNPSVGVSFRTWANMLMRNHLKNLLRNQTILSRGKGEVLLPLDEAVLHVNPHGIETVIDLIDREKNVSDHFM